jgi:hypothetical protein
VVGWSAYLVNCYSEAPQHRVRNLLFASGSRFLADNRFGVTILLRMLWLGCSLTKELVSLLPPPMVEDNWVLPVSLTYRLAARARGEPA